MSETSDCLCERLGLPEGMVCGNPDCHRGIAAQDSLRRICMPSGMPVTETFKLPDFRDKP